jgi:hypothetical protein
MKKIISVFQRNYDGDRMIRDEVVPGAEWVLEGDGVATRKYDGSCCMIKEGILYKRYDAKAGRTPPEGFIAAQEPDAKTGHWPGWIKVGDGPEDRWFREAFMNTIMEKRDGTYEAIGPHFQGNPERLGIEVLEPHGREVLQGFPRTFFGIKEALERLDIEGVVFHHPDGRMAKVKKKDYGLSRIPR